MFLQIVVLPFCIHATIATNATVKAAASDQPPLTSPRQTQGISPIVQKTQAQGTGIAVQVQDAQPISWLFLLAFSDF